MCHQCAHSYHTPIAMIPDPPMLSAPPPPPNNHPKRKQVYRKCSHQCCDNRVVQGGVCIAHGARQKCCAHPGCEKSVRNSGYCTTGMTGAHTPTTTTTTGKAVQRTRRKAAVSAASREDPALVSYDGDDANNEGDGNHKDGRSLRPAKKARGGGRHRQPHDRHGDREPR